VWRGGGWADVTSAVNIAGIYCEHCWFVFVGAKHCTRHRWQL
jgi:hypothetical protein